MSQVCSSDTYNCCNPLEKSALPWAEGELSCPPASLAQKLKRIPFPATTGKASDPESSIRKGTGTSDPVARQGRVWLQIHCPLPAMPKDTLTAPDQLPCWPVDPQASLISLSPLICPFLSLDPQGQGFPCLHPIHVLTVSFWEDEMPDSMSLPHSTDSGSSAT